MPRVVSARKHEILPKHQSRTVTHFVESLELVVASAPDPKHVEVASHCVRDEAGVVGWVPVALGKKVVNRDEIGSFGECRKAVD